MASIVLSFIGTQDPYSNQTKEEGSLITLLRFLVSRGTAIARVFLLYTEGTAQNARDTKDHIETEAQLQGLAVELLPTSADLSTDPTDLLKAAQEARRGLEAVKRVMEPGDRVEFNASSGTPAMKSAFSLLQAAGYAGNGQVWQVRNPQQMREGQTRVFSTDVDVLRREFDLKRLKQQIQDFNYSGALLQVTDTAFDCPIIRGLLDYGRCRKSFDFNRARDAIAPLEPDIDGRWRREIDALRKGNDGLLLANAYFRLELADKNRDYFTLLTLIATIQEKMLKFAVSRYIQLPEGREDLNRFWDDLKLLKEGQLLKQLASENIPTAGFPKRPHYFSILRFFGERQLVEHCDALDKSCQQRNLWIHDLKGVSDLREVDELLIKVRRLIKPFAQVSLTDNPFEALNAEILERLDGLTTT